MGNRFEMGGGGVVYLSAWSYWESKACKYISSSYQGLVIFIEYS